MGMSGMLPHSDTSQSSCPSLLFEFSLEYRPDGATALHVTSIEFSMRVLPRVFALLSKSWLGFNAIILNESKGLQRTRHTYGGRASLC